MDTNLPRNLAHSFVDLNNNNLHEKPVLFLFSEIYRANISGDGSYEKLLKKYEVTSRYQLDKEEEYYIPIGQKILIDPIQ